MADLINAAEVAQQARDVAFAAESVRPAMASAARKQIAALTTQLDRQFTWLGKNQNDPRYPEFFDRWERDLRLYEKACDALTAIPAESQGRLIA